MTIKTSLELVRYIRNHLSSSTWEDEKAVDAYVNLKTKAQLDKIQELEDVITTLRELRDHDQETIGRLKDPTE